MISIFFGEFGVEEKKYINKNLTQKIFDIAPFHFAETKLAGSYIISPTVRIDDRGWFYRMYDQQGFQQAGLCTNWLQMNHSYTQKKGTLRGMHFQFPPHGEVKLIRCVSGAVYDVMVDLRKDSPTFLQWVGVELSAKNKTMVYIPQGFAHGFQALENDSELIYQHSENYMPGSEGGLKYDDEKLGINWPLPIGLVSDRDLSHALITNDFKGI